MEKVIILRHGDYDRMRNLSEKGKDQIRRTAEFLRPHIEGKSIVLLSSPVGRAVQSAQELKERLGIASSVELHDALDSNHVTRTANVMDLIEQQTADVVLVMTHFELTKYLPRSWAHKHLSVKNFPEEPLMKGGAWIIDCEAKTCEEIQT